MNCQSLRLYFFDSFIFIIYLSIIINKNTMKDLNQFINMADELKATYLMDHGKFIIRKTEKSLAYDLYEVHGYFVEVMYDYKQANITGFSATGDFENVEKYFDIIDLGVLV